MISRYGQWNLIMAATLAGFFGMAAPILAHSEEAVIEVTVSLEEPAPADFRVFPEGDTLFVKPTGSAVTFAVYVENATGTVVYQWNRVTSEKTLLPIADAYAPIYSIVDLQKTDEGFYVCIATDEGSSQSAASPEFQLIVTDGIPALGLFGLLLVAFLMAFVGAAALLSWTPCHGILHPR